MILTGACDGFCERAQGAGKATIAAMSAAQAYTAGRILVLLFENYATE